MTIRFIAVFLATYCLCWLMISLGQSAASGKPVLQCLMSSKHDCGPAVLLHHRVGGDQ